MDASKFKDITEKLRFLKDYSSLVIPAVIALVGVVIFVLALLMKEHSEGQQNQESEQASGFKRTGTRRKEIPGQL